MKCLDSIPCTSPCTTCNSSDPTDCLCNYLKFNEIFLNLIFIIITACIGNNRDLSSCSCTPGFYDNGGNDCLPCSEPCATCSASASNCDSCLDPSNRLVTPDCDCKDRFYSILPTDPVC